MLNHSVHLFFTALHRLQPSPSHRADPAHAVTATASTDSHYLQSPDSCGESSGDRLQKSFELGSEISLKAVGSSGEDASELCSAGGVSAATGYDGAGDSENCPHRHRGGAASEHQPLGGTGDSKQRSASFCGTTTNAHATAGTGLSPEARSQRGKVDVVVAGESAEAGEGRLGGGGGRGEERGGGGLARAVWLSEGVCLVPSDASLFVSWRVDFVSALCSCPWALMTGEQIRDKVPQGPFRSFLSP